MISGGHTDLRAGFISITNKCSTLKKLYVLSSDLEELRIRNEFAPDGGKHNRRTIVSVKALADDALHAHTR